MVTVRCGVMILSTVICPMQQIAGVMIFSFAEGVNVTTKSSMHLREKTACYSAADFLFCRQAAEKNDVSEYKSFLSQLCCMKQPAQPLIFHSKPF